MTIDQLTHWLWSASAALLLVAVLLTGARLLLGPGSLDRLVALDTLAAIGQCALGVTIAWSGDTTPAAAIVALALLTFLGSVSAARFRVPDDQGAGPDASAVTVDGTVTRSGDRAPRAGSRPDDPQGDPA